MPRYDFLCSACGYEFERDSTIAKMDEHLSLECPNCKEFGHISRLIGSPPILDPVQLGIRRPDNTFQNRLKGIHDVHSMQNTGRYGHNITEY